MMKSRRLGAQQREGVRQPPLLRRNWVMIISISRLF
ncbi:MAG: hypothetical protein ACI8RN_002825 [Glaciecola sp.]